MATSGVTTAPPRVTREAEHTEHERPGPPHEEGHGEHDHGEEKGAEGKGKQSKAKKFFDDHKLAIISVLVGIAGIVLFLVMRSKSSSASTAGTGTTPNPAAVGPGGVPGGGGTGTLWPGTITPGAPGAPGPTGPAGAPGPTGAPAPAGAPGPSAVLPASVPSSPKAAANTPQPAKPGSAAMIANQIITAESQTGQGQSVVSSLEAGAINPKGITATPQQLAQASNAALLAQANGGTPAVSPAQAEANPYSAGFVNVGGEWVPLNNPTSAQVIASTNNPNFGSQALPSPSSPAGRVPGGTIAQTPQYGAYRSSPARPQTRTVRHTTTRSNPGHPGTRAVVSRPRAAAGHNFARP